MSVHYKYKTSINISMFFLQREAFQIFKNNSFTSTQVVPTPTKVAKITAAYSPLPSVFPENVNQDSTVNKKVIPGTPEVNISCTIKLFFGYLK